MKSMNLKKWNYYFIYEIPFTLENSVVFYMSNIKRNDTVTNMIQTILTMENEMWNESTASS